VLVFIGFPLRLSYLGVLPFTLLHLPLDFIRISSLWSTYLLTYSLSYRRVSRHGTGSSPRRCGPRGACGRNINNIFV